MRLSTNILTAIMITGAALAPAVPAQAAAKPRLYCLVVSNPVGNVTQTVYVENLCGDPAKINVARVGTDCGWEYVPWEGKYRCTWARHAKFQGVKSWFKGVEYYNPR